MVFATELYTYINEANVKPLQVSFLNVGQGDSTLVQTPGGQILLIDGGAPRSPVLSEIGSTLPFYKKRIDIVIATHPDADHIGELPDVIKRYKPKVILVSGVYADTWIDQSLQNTINENNVLKLLARKGMIIKFKSNKVNVEASLLKIIFPDRDVSQWVKKTNDASIVATLEFGATSFLFTGDSPMSVEKYLIRNKLLHSVDVLKVGHHGSRTSTSPDLINVINPKYAVISAGKKNKYKHPHQEVIDRLEKSKIKILRTGSGKSIKIESDGINFSFD